MGRKKRIAPMIVASLGIAGFCWAQEGLFRDVARPALPVPPMVITLSDFSTPAGTPETRGINDALDKPLTKFSKTEAPLKQTLDELAKESGLPLWVNWPALATAGVDENTKVSVAAGQLTPRRVLKNVLAVAGGGAANLKFIIADGQVAISTSDDLHSQRYQVLCVYNVDFLYADVEFNGPAAEAIQTAIGDTLKQLIEQDSWRDNGGTVGSVRFLGGQMIVNQTMDAQEQVGQFVAAMRVNGLKSMKMYDVRDLIKDAAPDAAGNNPKLEALTDAIETTCGRETWRGRGGKSSSLAVFDGRLYINASPIVHQQVDILLGLMRRKD